MRLLVILLMVMSLAVIGCQGTPAPSPYEGAWMYALTDQHRNTYDQGTITFPGPEGDQAFRQVNAYAIASVGSFTFDGKVLMVKTGEEWRLTTLAPLALEGTWTTEGSSGTVLLKRK